MIYAQKKPAKLPIHEGFGFLIEEAVTSKVIKDFSYVMLDNHPFSLPIPNWGNDWETTLAYVGYPTDSEATTRSLIRLVAYQLGCAGIGDHQPVRFLRIIRSESDDDGVRRPETEHYYYEVGIGHHHFMGGGFTSLIPSSTNP